ncbi:hypothetical protein EGI24_16085 [Lacihabitans sp. CS3-21]|nr:hypothetical protein [Lacihabitans sp. CS3-21]
MGVFSYLEDYVDIMKKEDRIGRANAYRSATNSIKRFVAEMPKSNRNELNLPIFNGNNSIEIPFDIVTDTFLQDYENSMLQSGKKGKSKEGVNSPATLTSAGINLRQLRSIFNVAK